MGKAKVASSKEESSPPTKKRKTRAVKTSEAKKVDSGGNSRGNSRREGVSNAFVESSNVS
jgi:hypothetical protein